MRKIVSLEQVDFVYDHRPVLEGINLEVEEGDFLAVVGPNGGGKTTLLRLILGYLSPVSGSIRVLEQAPRNVRSQIGYVPQHGEFARDFPVTVKDVVLMGRIKPGSLFPGYNEADLDAAAQAMEAVSILELADRRFGALSGGQKQRTLIARALSSNPLLLLLDEPTASVDSRVEKDIYELLRALNKRMTIIMVSHDLGFVSSYVNKVACVNRRLVVHPAHEISSQDIIDEAYDSAMHSLRHECRL
jgi:zinc transport system ATP-binding protein